MRMRWKVTYRGPLGEKIKRMREFAREALDGVARLWSKEYRKRHFDRGARRRYDYAPRSASYQRRKIARQGGSIWDRISHLRVAAPFGIACDLVYTGRLRRLFTGSAMRRIMGRKVKVYARAPKYVFFHRGQAGHPDIPKELTTVSPDEDKALGSMVETTMARRLNEPTPVVTERI